MPIINRESIYFENAQFARVISVDSKGVFSIKLPPQVTLAGLGEKVEAPTRDAALRAFGEKLQQYKDSKTSVRRIIAYSFEANARIMDSENERCIMSRSDITFADTGMILGLSAEVFDEYEIKGSGKGSSYRYEKVDGAIPHSLDFSSRGGPRDYTSDEQWSPQLPYSVEAEQFFAKIGRSLEATILMLNQGFKSPETVTALVAGGGFPLLTQ